jgi:hypothetical protein
VSNDSQDYCAQVTPAPLRGTAPASPRRATPTCPPRHGVLHPHWTHVATRRAPPQPPRRQAARLRDAPRAPPRKPHRRQQVPTTHHTGPAVPLPRAPHPARPCSAIPGRAPPRSARPNPALLSYPGPPATRAATLRHPPSTLRTPVSPRRY